VGSKLRAELVYRCWDLMEGWRDGGEELVVVGSLLVLGDGVTQTVSLVGGKISRTWHCAEGAMGF
jgi:hypothetical protein